ncbi:MAG TPA: Gfo/Idh/MocA family oxidoreductase [Terriglobia bacterium]|nr:Gfo/Idh/MocA family oxidoreductase [Terriglobia bacterium]
MKTGEISRRAFMQRTAGAAGAAVAGRRILLKPDSVRAAGAARPVRAVAPSDAVHFGIIGVGMQGSGLLRTSIALPGVECIAACDLYDGRIELAKEIVGKDKPLATTKRYQELLENKDIDCIIAAVPDHWHKHIIVDACNAGKDIYCEKPMTHKVEEGFEIIEAEHRNNRIVQIGSQRRSSMIYAKARELVQQGRIGEVCLVEASLGRNDPCGAWQYTVPTDLSPETVDWETWLGSAPQRAFDPLRWTRWRCYQDYGEGIPGDLFVHLLTGIHTVMDVTAPPERALSSGGLFRWHDGRDVPDCLTTLYDYGKFRTTVRVTLNTDGPEITRFMGPGGSIEIHDGSVTLFAQEGVDNEPCTPGWPAEMRHQYADRWHAQHEKTPGTFKPIETVSFYPPADYNEDREHLWNYFQSVRTRSPSVEDGTFGNHAAIGCHIANYSYFNRCAAEWDGASKRIRKA